MPGNCHLLVDYLADRYLSNALRIPPLDPLAQKLEILLAHISRLIRQMMPRLG